MLLRVTKKENNLVMVTLRDDGLNLNLMFLNSEENGHMSLPTVLHVFILEKPPHTKVRVHWSCKYGPTLNHDAFKMYDQLIGIQLSMDILTEDDEAMAKPSSRLSKPSVQFFSCEHNGVQLNLSGKVLCARHHRPLERSMGRHLCTELRLNLHDHSVMTDNDVTLDNLTEDSHQHSEETFREYHNTAISFIQIPLAKVTPSHKVFNESYSKRYCPDCKFYKKRSDYENSVYFDFRHLDR